MDFFERTKNFFTGGGWSSDKERSKSDAERRRREEEERRRREAARQAQKQQVQKQPALSATPTIETKPRQAPKAPQVAQAPKPTTAPRATVKPSVDALKMNINQGDKTLPRGVTRQEMDTVKKLQSQGKTQQAQALVKTIQDARKAKNVSAYENSVPGRVLNTGGQVLRTIAQGVADTTVRGGEFVERLGAPIKEAGIRASSRNQEEANRRLTASRNDITKRYQGTRRAMDDFFSRSTRNEKGETYSEETDREAREISSGKAGVGTLVSAALKSLDMATFLPASRTASSAEKVVELGATATQAGKKAFDDMIKSIEQKIDDTLTPPQVREARKAFEEEAAKRAVKPQADVDTPAPKTTAKAPTPEEQKVATSYQTVQKAITEDKSLSPQQKDELVQEARKRHSEMLENLNAASTASRQAQKEVVDTAQRQIDETADSLSANVDELQQTQTNRTQPQPEEVVQDTPAPQGSPEQVANDAYQKPGLDEFRETRESIQKAQERSVPERVWTAIKRSVVDPSATTQKLDNQWLKQQKQSGNLRKGQSYLDPGDSLTVQSGIINNPDQIVRLALKRSTPGRASVESIVKKYAKQGEEAVQDFNDYRIFKDELWRMSPDGGGNPNTINIDPGVMAQYVRDYEKANPGALADSAQLRQFSLENFARRVQAGSESREMFENSARNPFYTPRERTSPDDAIRPTVSGVYNKAAKTTQGRAFAASGVGSPLDLFERDVRDTIVAEAVQRRASILQERGYNVSQSAEDQVRKRDIRNEMKDLGDIIQRMKSGIRDASSNKKVNKAELNGLYRQGGEIMRRHLINQSTDSAGEGMAKRMSISELSDLFKYAVDTDEIPGKTLNKVMKKKEALGEALSSEIDATREIVRGVKQHRSDLYGELMDITHNPLTGNAEVTYKVDGELGKIEIPTELADEWSKNAKLMERTPMEKLVEVGVVNPFKVAWTGMLAPVFQLKQIFMNTGLAFRNADGLSGISPQAQAEFLKSVFYPKVSRGFKEKLIERGAQFENATRSAAVRRSITDDFVRHSSLGNFAKGGVSSLGDVARTINNALAHVSNAQRMQVARGAYERARRLGMGEEEALRFAAQAPVQVMGDFNRVSKLARNLEVVMPYSGAIQAGARAIGQASKRKPLETLVKDGVIVGSLAGLAFWNLYNGNEDFYRDRIEQGKEYELDNNLIISSPGAHKDENGNWHGIWMIPLTPDMRPLNRAVWRTAIPDANENGGAMYAYEMFNFFTGDSANSVFDEGRTDEGRNPFGGLFSGSPLLNVGRVLSNQNLYSGSQQVDETMRSRNPEDQVWDSTSQVARGLSGLLGGAVTPIQADQMLQQFGNLGRGLRAVDNEEKNPLKEFFRFGSAFEPAVSTSEEKLNTRQYFQDMDDVFNQAAREGFDEKTLKEFRALHSKKTEEQKKSLLTTATKAHQFMQYTGDGTFTTTPLFELEKRLDNIKRERGEPGNPIYDLAPQELQAVLTYRSMKIPNSAKQNYSKDGEGAFTALGLDNQWYSNFQKAESAYYDATIKDNGKDGEMRTFSGESKPKLTPEQERLEQQYYSLPEKSAERRAFRDANPWLTEYWASANDFTNEERKALGFRPLEANSSSGGGGGGSYSPYGVLGELFNASALKRFDNVSEAPYEAVPKDIEKLLRSLMARNQGGGASIQIGGQSRGDTSRSDIG